MTISSPAAARPKRRCMRVAALVATLGMFAVACGDDGGEKQSSSSATTSSVAASATTKAPVKGGSLTFATYAAANRLDSAFTTGSGNAGVGNELGALYDRLVDWAPATKKYVPKTA